MITQNCVYLLVFFVVIQTIAQDLSYNGTFTSEVHTDEYQEENSNESVKASNGLAVSWFVRQTTFVDYIFKEEKYYYTQFIASGLAFNYKKGLIELGAALNNRNSWAYFMAMCYTLDVKKLDENWIRLFSGFGEIAVVPEQQSNPDLWFYTLGLVGVIARPFKWGTPALALTVGGAYHKDEVNLNIRAFFNLAIPIN